MSESTIAATRSLPEAPSLEYLRNQAKSLHKAIQANDPDALSRLRAVHPQFPADRPRTNTDESSFRQRPLDIPLPARNERGGRGNEGDGLTDAQLVIAREYGFESWPKLKAEVDARTAEQLVRQFKSAVDAGDAEQVGKLLRSHPILRRKIDSPWFSFDSPAIVRAASSGNRPMIDALLAAGANVNVRSSWEPGGFGTLDNADPETAAYLISKGAYVDIHAAAKLGDLARVRELVENDPSLVNARGGDGQTPLHFASTIEICAYLLDHGTEINTRDIDHISTAAQYSIRNPEKLRYLVDHDAEADIFIACRLGDKNLALKLLNETPDCLRWRLSHPSYRHDAGHIYMYLLSAAARPLTLAADYGGHEYYEFLLTKTSPVVRLLLACAFADKAGVDNVLRESPDVVRTLTADDAAFIVDAAWENRLDAVRTMLDAGFDIDARGMEDGTALERAAVRGWAPLVRLLIERGASLDIRNQYGGVPLGAALWGSENWPRDKGNHPECVEALIDAGSSLPDQLSGGPEVQEILKKHGVGQKEGA